jgi:hypothetical protein
VHYLQAVLTPSGRIQTEVMPQLGKCLLRFIGSSDLRNHTTLLWFFGDSAPGTDLEVIEGKEVTERFPQQLFDYDRVFLINGPVTLIGYNYTYTRNPVVMTWNGVDEAESNGCINSFESYPRLGGEIIEQAYPA